MTEKKCIFFHFFFEKKGIFGKNVLRSRKLLITNHLCGGLNAHFHKLLIANYINKICCKSAVINRQNIMENVTNLVIWFAFSGLASMIFVSNIWKPVKRNELDIKFAYEIALHRAEQREILKHKWLESEKAGRDIGMELAQKSWEEYHAEDWRQSKRKAA